ncbi:hypothetical protein [Rhizobium leguminosarum]|uniref:DUF2158 domain-containing protein n=1 Tax=Rhizobium leguminosarum TaxID=384 RepID=A0A1B1C9U8_RHILE|nr:hypothetical protein [Rhizobium leguminosarum]ANP86510.1 hypothetical protein BA011_12760 [Rhizobium leguminosarum]
MTKFVVGDRIKVREGAELKFPDHFKKVGKVVETADIPAYGDVIRVHWTGQPEPEAAFSESALFDLVEDTQLRK